MVPNTTNTQEFEIDVSKLFKQIYAKKAAILSIALSFLLIGTLTAYLIPNKYTAHTLIAPNTPQNSSGISQLSANLGQIATSVGISSLNSNSSTPTDIAIETLKSRKFLINFVKTRNIAHELLATKKWDHEENAWVFDEKIYDAKGNSWRENNSKKPSDLSLYNAIRNALTITKQKDTNFYEIEVSSNSPEAAHRWLTHLVADLNQFMREQALQDSKNSIEYLASQIDDSNLTEVKSLFYALLESEIKNQMLAKSKQSFVFTVIDPSILPEQKSSPNRPLIIFGATFLGLIAGIIFAIYSSKFEDISN